MIEILLQFGPDFILVRVDGHNVQFANTAFGAYYAPIEGLQLSKQGVEKEFPDLKDKPEWRAEAIQRFKNMIVNLKNEVQVADYIIGELRKVGYKPLYLQKKGFRREVIKNG